MVTEKRLTGAFYTCDTVADYLTAWAIQDKNDSMLEPSFGDGVFIEAAVKVFTTLKNSNPLIYAVELQQVSYDKYMKDTAVPIQGFCQDFMEFNQDIRVNAVIGNPPYVRLKNLTSENRRSAVSAVEKLNIKMLSSSSLWMPFVVHATQFLLTGGKIGFVLPYELTYVKYAYPLWDYLKDNFGSITVSRVHEDIFPEVDVETILFMAEDFGSKTDYVNYLLYSDKEQLFSNCPIKSEKIAIRDIVSGKKPFVWALLTNEQKELLKSYQQSKTISPLSRYCKFKIGYVCADKNFFHPNSSTVQKYKIPERNLLPCISNAKDINGGTGIGAVVSDGQCMAKLYVPLTLEDGDKRYIKHGEALEVHKRYKCKIRTPWYITPTVERADLIMTVFGDVPKLLANEGNYVVSNSLLSGILIGDTTSKEIVCRWYNSLTLLSAELNVHSLGGGVLVFIPGETDKIEILNDFPLEMIDSTIDKLNKCILEDGLKAAYTMGDEIVLKRICKFSDDEISTIRNALEKLQFWRRPEKRRPKK